KTDRLLPLNRVLVPAANPFNPFGTDVRVDYVFPESNASSFEMTTNFSRPLVGVRGTFSQWDWEVALWQSEDRIKQQLFNYLVNNSSVTIALAQPDPARSLNLFATGAPASQDVLSALFISGVQRARGQTQVVNAFVR